jgi:hypothetical protein
VNNILAADAPIENLTDTHCAEEKDVGTAGMMVIELAEVRVVDKTITEGTGNVNVPEL